MKEEIIAKLFEKFEDVCYIYNGVECWSARELQEILGYAQWRNFGAVNGYFYALKQNYYNKFIIF